MELIEAMNWRYAAKRMNGAKIPASKIDNILEAIRLSASSGGLQPYKVIVISSQEWREKIHGAVYSQPAVIEGSHFLVFASLKNITEAYVEEQVSRMAEVREIGRETLDPLATAIKSGILSRPDDVNANWAARQAYIALGTGIVAAATEGVDATPMEGFDQIQLDELLGLDKMGLQSVVVMALGYRDEANDFLSKAKKVRQTREELFIEMN